MRAVLGEDGWLLLDSRNWERLRAQRPSLTVLDPRVREGKCCIPLYLWDIPDARDQPHGVKIVLLFGHGGRASARRYPLRFSPFRFDELRRCLAVASLEIIKTDYAEEKDRYDVVARRIAPVHLDRPVNVP